MCRLAAYIGAEIPLENILIKPEHSLLEQNQDAREAKMTVNGDGFGIAWYASENQLGVYRDVALSRLKCACFAPHGHRLRTCVENN